MPEARFLTEETKTNILKTLLEGDKTYTEILNETRDKDSGRFNYHLKQLISFGLVEQG